MNRRGLTPIVGFVILVGIAAIGAMSLFVAGLALADATQSDAEQQQVERSMSQFAETAGELAVGESNDRKFTIEGSQSASAALDEDAGRIRIVLEDDGTREIMNNSLGALRYERDDGTEAAYQGGGVWRKDESGASMIRPPEFHYRSDTDDGATLTFPLVRLDGSINDKSELTGSLSVEEQNQLYPTGNDSNPLKGGEVFVEIESRYCSAWETYLEDRTDSSVVERCSGSTNTEEGELRFELVVPGSALGPIDEGVRVPGEFDVDGGGKNGLTINGDVTTSDKSDVVEEKTDIKGEIKEDANLSLPGVQGQIDDYIRECNTDDDLSWTSDPDPVISEPGVHCIDGDHTFTKNDDLTIQANKGKITLVFNDSFKSNHNLTVEGQDEVNIYVKNEAELHGLFGNPSDPQQTRLFVGGTNSRALDAQAQSELYGFLYAPHGGADIRSQSGLTGAVFAEDVALGGSETYVDFVNFENPPTFGDDDTDSATIYYLHVSETVMSVEDN